MLFRVLADLTMVVHFAFVLFVVGGGVLVLRWGWVALLHLPAFVWGVLIMFVGWICPLTPLENHLRGRAGQEGYDGGFIEHYIVSVLYPASLTRAHQVALGLGVLLLNGALYVLLLRRRRSRRG